MTDVKGQRIAIALAAGLAIAALLASACSSSDAAPPPTGGPASPVPPTAPPSEAVVIDWNDAEGITTFANGWTVRDCEGDAPLLCVYDGDEWLGILEAASSPLDNELAALLDAEGPAAALAHHVESYHATFAVDRENRCGPGYGYTALDTVEATLAGHPALRFGFAGTRDGVEVERNLSYVSIFDGQLKLITATANDPDSCVYSDEFRELTPAALREFETHLDALAAGSRLPRSTALVDGSVVGVDGGLDGGMVFYVWHGEKQRIQQPRAMTEDEVITEGLRRGAAVATLAADGPEGSYFVVVPPDGPQAELHVVLDGTIHPVLVQEIDPETVRSIPDASTAITTRLRHAT